MDDETKRMARYLKESFVNMDDDAINGFLDTIFSFITDLSRDGEKKLTMIARLMVKAYLENKKLFYTTIARLLDYTRNDPNVDIFSLMLAQKKFNTADLARVFSRLLGEGTISILELDNFIPRNASDDKKISLLARLLKLSPEGVIRDTVLDLLIDVLIPPIPESLDPTAMMNLDFMENLLVSTGRINTLYRKGYPVELVIARLGEQQGVQLAIFFLIMMGQAGLKDGEIDEILERMENPVFSGMFKQAKSMMDATLAKGLGIPPGTMEGVPGPRAPTLPGIGLGKGLIPEALRGSGRKGSIIQRIVAGLMKFFLRFRKR